MTDSEIICYKVWQRLNNSMWFVWQLDCSEDYADRVIARYKRWLKMPRSIPANPVGCGGDS